MEKLIRNKEGLKEYISNNSKLPIIDNGISKSETEFLWSIIDAIEKNESNSTFRVEELASEMSLRNSHFYTRLR